MNTCINLNEVFNLEDYNEEYIFYTNEEDENVIKKVGTEKSKEINMIFDKSETTNIMKEVIKQLTKYYIEDILKIQM